MPASSDVLKHNQSAVSTVIQYQEGVTCGPSTYLQMLYCACHVSMHVYNQATPECQWPGPCQCVNTHIATKVKEELLPMHQ